MAQLTLQQALNLAIEHHRAGRLDAAAEIHRQILARLPDQPDALHLLGVIYQQQGRGNEALQLLQRAIAVSPSTAIYHANLGNALSEQGRWAEAIEAFSQSLTLNSNVVETHLSLGAAFERLSQMNEAIAVFRRATELDPQNAAVWCHLGHLQGQQYELTESIQSSRRALELHPDYAEARFNLAGALLRQGLVNESIRESREAMKFSPNSAAGLSNLLLSLNYASALTPEEVFVEHTRFGDRFEFASPPVHPNTRNPRRILRVGYISPDLRDHPVRYFIEPVLAHHDSAQFEVLCYSHDSQPDAVTERLRRYKLTWRSIHMLSDADAAALIRQDQIDILIDLAGHTAHSRLTVLAYEPAPIQVTFLGYPNTTGLRAVKFRMTDALADPPGQSDELHVEKLVRLPRTAWCYQPASETPDVNDLPARTLGYLTFGSFNAVPKVTPSTIELWARLLTLVPGSRLMLKAVALFDGSTRERLTADFGRHGIGQERLILRPALEKPMDHLETYRAVDIALDPWLYNGTTTTCESLWMGVPVVTLKGETHASRVGTSLMTNVGLPELVARTPDEYLEIAAKLAGDLDKLATVRAGMRNQMQASPIMDAAGFTRDLENAYRAMWKEWCSA
jgi:protein O-GlcNAc transferase